MVANSKGPDRASASQDADLRGTVHRQIEAQVAATPDAVAVICRDDRLTYAALNARANQLAGYIGALNLPPESIIGVCHDRTIGMLVSILAVMKAGGAYLPLDPTYPRERLALMIEDSATPLLITDHQTNWVVPVGSAVPSVDSQSATASEFPESNLGVAVRSSHLAYVIYTSGSTGRPKGVMVEHGNVLSFFAGMDERVGTRPGVWLAVTSLSFDISVLELLWTLARGFTVVLHNPSTAFSESDSRGRDFSIAAEIAGHGVTHLQCTPSMAGVLMMQKDTREALGALTTVLVGGEVFPVNLARDLRQVVGGRILNMYGPTETTIWSSSHVVESVGSIVPIGTPILDTGFHVLDEALKPVAPGESGQLFISGPGVVRGYLNRSDLTSERFVQLTGPGSHTVRAYCTGDLVRSRPGSGFEFLGRSDDQVKIRGHRIEPGEIEAALCELPQVREAAVVAREVAGDLRLIAYCVFAAVDAIAPSEVRGQLRLTLPDHMVPSHVVELAALPKTPNGKVDRKALPALTSVGLGLAEAGSEGIGLESEIAQIWRAVLNVPQVGRHESFFDLGGNSVVALEVQRRLHRIIGWTVPLDRLLRMETVQMLADDVRRGAHAAIDEESERRGLKRRASLTERRRLRGHQPTKGGQPDDI